jgi:hypothetical protein
MKLKLVTFLFGIFAIQAEILDLKHFSIVIPVSWKYEKRAGFDSFVGSFILSEKHELRFDYGMYSGNIEDDNEYFMSNDSLYVVKGSYEYSLDKKLDKSFFKMKDEAKVLKTNKPIHVFHFELIDGRIAKVLEPLIIGNGKTGICFREDKQSGYNYNLRISGYNLTGKEKREFLIAMRSIKTKKE